MSHNQGEVITVVLTDEELDEIFGQEGPSSARVIDVYKLVIEKAGFDWDDVEQIDDAVRCSKPVNEMFFKRFIDYDKKRKRKDPTKQFVSGGNWLNWGFYQVYPDKQDQPNLIEVHVDGLKFAQGVIA